MKTRVAKRAARLIHGQLLKGKGRGESRGAGAVREGMSLGEAQEAEAGSWCSNPLPLCGRSGKKRQGREGAREVTECREPEEVGSVLHQPHRAGNAC